MTSRAYTVVVVLWVLAAIVAGSATLSRRTQQLGALEATEALRPGDRAAASFETDDTLPSALRGVVSEAVDDAWSGPGERPFWVVARASIGADPRARSIGSERYPLTLRMDGQIPEPDGCGACHEGRQVTDIRADIEGAVHQNIQPVHPSVSGGECSTCHVATDVSRVQGAIGEPASFTHAYRLCSQCHYAAVDSWAKGAHGKRLVGWRGRRVVFGCADCHDPHAPATEIRAPYSGVRLPGDLRGEHEHDDEGEGH